MILVRVAAASLLAVLVMLVVPPASAHAYLEASNPPANGSLPTGAGVLALRFTELFDPDHAAAHLVDENGSALPSSLTFPSQRPYEMRVESPPLDTGIYTLHWRLLGVDGHQAAGSFRFSVGGEPLDPIAARAYDPASIDAASERWDAVGRGLFVAGLLAVLGVPVFASEIAQVKVLPRRVPVVMAGAAVLGGLGAFVSLAAIAQAIGEPLATAASSTAGRFLLGKASLMAAAGGLAGIAVVRPRTRRPWALAAILPAFVAAVMHSMGGHGLLAPGAGEGVAGHVGMTLHLVVAALWAGGVVGFILLLPGLDRAAAAGLVRRFTPLALASVVVLAATGLYQALIHLPAGAVGGIYLELLFWKTGLLIALVAFGAWHMLWLRPRLEQGSKGPATLARSLRGEAFVLAAVVGVAGLLGAVPVPASPPDADERPLAVAESEATLGDYRARAAVMSDPLLPDRSYDLVIGLHALTSRRVDAAQLEAHLVAPDGRQTAIALERTVAGTWQGAAVFPEAGAWGLHVALTQPSGDGHTFPLRVLDPAKL